MRGPSTLVINNGYIEEINTLRGDPQYHLLSPGFVDIQMNGFDKWDVSVCDTENLRALDNALLRLGTTSWLGTIVTAPLERLTESLQRLNTSFTSQDIPGMVGVHLEGPFLGTSPGAHNPKWIVPVNMQWVASLPECVRLVTVAAEQGDAGAVIGHLTQRGTCVSIGHSQPTAQQMQDAIANGASMVTHLYNGMSGVHHRDDGLALMALTNDNLRVGLIVDMVHVSPSAVSLAFRAKDSRGICLVSDSIAWKSDWALARNIEVRDGAPRLPNGTLAGSSTPLSHCVANAVNHCGIDVEDALRSATSVPARTVGLSDVGHLTIGKKADVIALDSQLSVVNAWRRLPSERA